MTLIPTISVKMSKILHAKSSSLSMSQYELLSRLAGEKNLTISQMAADLLGMAISEEAKFPLLKA